MTPKFCLRSVLLAGAVIAAVGIALYTLRVPVLGKLGHLLVVSTAPTHADILVVIRGDETYFERTLTAADLFHAGYASHVYVSSALNDLPSTQLRRRGIKLPSAQENIASILLQSNVPCDRILLDVSPPGGGTLGEARRLLALMISRDLSSALLVTSWFHSRRTKWIMDSVLGDSGKKSTVVLAESPIGPDNWWTFRYATLTVVEEYFKLAAQGTVGDVDFSDNPPLNRPYKDVIRSPAGCPQSS